ncbi:MAG: EamA family transporter [Clostridia bacterium]|nr:EamA family transporter [Clostridia bacterium]
MGYLYLTLALIGGLVKGFVGKRVSNDVHSLKDCIYVNFLRLFFCAIISFVILITQQSFSFPPIAEIPFYLFSAVCMSAFCIVFMLGYKTAAYIYLSLFGMLGAVITGLLGHFIYKEPLSVYKILGMVLLIFAMVIMSKYNKAITLKDTKKILPILILAAVSVSLSDFSQKIFVNEIGRNAAEYNFYTYSFSALLLIPAIFIAKGSLKANGAPLTSVRHTILCLLIAAALFMNSFSKTLAANFLTSAEIYPVLQGANLIASALLAQILLKEKITTRAIIGMAIAFLGLVLMNLC